MTFTYNSSNVVAEYGGDDCCFQSITTMVALICDPLVDAPESKALGRLTENVVGFSIRSKRLCPTADITTEEATTSGQTTPHEITEIPLTTPFDFGTTCKPAILCDYTTLLGDTLKRCVFEASDSFVTPFAPPYLDTSKSEASQFCSNIQWVNKCIQDAIQYCSFDGRVTAFFGSSDLGLQAAYDSLCAHPSNVSLPAFNCLTLRRLEDYQSPLNEFIIKADKSSNPSEICAFGSYMVSSMTELTAVYCGRWFKVWTLFWDNVMAGCQ